MPLHGPFNPPVSNPYKSNSIVFKPKAPNLLLLIKLYISYLALTVHPGVLYNSNIPIRLICFIFYFRMPTLNIKRSRLHKEQKLPAKI